MDIFKFNNQISNTALGNGEIINGIKSKMWIERYRDCGEFTIVAKLDSGVREKLPIGSLISHIDTTEIMIVENHEIPDGQDEVTITGRGFESFFEQRIVGSNKNYPTVSAPSDYVLPAAFTWVQAIKIINDHISSQFLLDQGNAIPFVTVMSDVAGTSVSESRVIKLGTLYQRLMELLDINDLGVKIIRPGPWSPLGAASPNTAIVIHVGMNRTSQVIFSHDTGEIASAQYLWSNKKFKNTALVSGRWVETVVTTSATNYDRRMMLVEASDIDQKYEAAPSGLDRTSVISAMQQRGIAALASQPNISLAKAEVSRERTKAVYRTDFNVGDTITVNGDYNATSAMRVSEYVEIEDENGISAYPTLATI